MKRLYYFNPLTVRRGLVSSDVQTWSKIYGLIGATVGMVDRTGLLAQPVRTAVYDQCQMPAFQTTDLTYDDCVDQRVQELYELGSRLNLPLNILWSGGIDSTMILVGFLRRYSLADLQDRIKIVTSWPAIPENPQFYYKFILPNFELLNSNLIPWMFDSQGILVTGELNDQLFGSDLIRNYLLQQGPDLINQALNKDAVLNYVKSLIKHDQAAEILVHGILNSAAHQGIVLEKNTDFFWWYNFCYKWQTVTFRIYAVAAARLAKTIGQSWHEQHLQHFYSSSNFQLWSMNHPEVRVIRDFKHYKQQAKQSIYAFDHNLEYRDNKIKRGSLSSVFEQRRVCEAITEDFEFLYDFNPGDYYQAENQFNTQVG